MRKGVTWYSLGEAAKYADLSEYMVDYLCRTRVLEPSLSTSRRRGRSRRYSFQDVVFLRALKRLLDDGIEVSKLKYALRKLQEISPGITRTSLPGSLIVGNRKALYYRERKELVHDLLKGQYAFSFVLEVGQLRQDVVAAMPSKKAKPLKTGT